MDEPAHSPQPYPLAIFFSFVATALVACFALPVPALAKSTTPVYRLCQYGTNYHLWTTDAHEYEVLAGLGWRQEGIAWQAPTSGITVNVYRLYNPSTGNHLYTTNVIEYQFLGLIGWKKEGTAFRSELHSNYPVYRLSFYSNNDHMLTLDLNEYDTLGTRGWNKENVAFYVSGTGSFT